MELINLTPHVLNVVKEDGSVLTIPPSGQIARCAQVREKVGKEQGVALFSSSYGEVTGLPDQDLKTGHDPQTDAGPCKEPKFLYIVSGVVRAALTKRLDLASPGELVRGPDGQPIGCKGLDVNF